MMQRLWTIAGLLLSLTLIGAVGFHVTTGARWIDCIYMAVITLSTVGYREAVPLGDGGKLFVILFLILGLGTFTYSAFQLGQLIVSAEFRSLLEKRRMARSINELSNHYIVCGLGRVGRTVCGYLDERGTDFVVIDHNEDRLRSRCHEKHWPFIIGDATNDDVLIQAGIGKAQALASVLPTDADNVYVVLSARMLNTAIQIIVRASDERAIEKLERAGANRVISPLTTGGVKMARFMLNPSIEDFLEIADSHGNDLELADIQVTEGSTYIGQRLDDTNLRQNGVMIIGIRRSDGERLMPPPGDALIHEGDSLFAFGTADSVNRMMRV
ncbi:MAG: potassium channel protein [Planctomycetota bacterium]|nr:potassium channel protein [Planctomycetota bacterium]